MDDLGRWCALHGFERERAGAVLRAYVRVAYATARRLPPWPSVVTGAGLALALLTVPLYGPPWVAPLVLASGAADGLDGAVAAVRGRASTFGAVLDSTADRLADLALLLGPALHVPGARAALVAAGAGTFLLEYVRARCQAVGLTERQPVTPAERPVRVVAAALLAVVPGAWAWAGWALAALCALSALRLVLDARARSTTATSA
ncbi:MAG TPA: CDP-alcohol phosphatidyltransferase family protein [Frankiaceae bacterium]|jgi:CDP-diacylglycerol--glycerol-3-phosphate 3-phosphatidyltransferase|nr:CDP-alcohol phosphatidyltransferase family protein [Frankiaceae bacterium]